MDFARFELVAKAFHNMLVLFNTGKAFKSSTFHKNFPMVRGPGEVNNLYRVPWVVFLEAFFHLLLCHRGVLPEDDRNKQLC